MSELVFCIKCKSKTETENPTNVVSPKGVEMLQGTCTVCKSKKSKIVRKLKKTNAVKEEPKEEPKGESSEESNEEIVESAPKRRKSRKSGKPRKGKSGNRTAVCSPVC